MLVFSRLLPALTHAQHVLCCPKQKHCISSNINKKCIDQRELLNNVQMTKMKWCYSVNGLIYFFLFVFFFQVQIFLVATLTWDLYLLQRCCAQKLQGGTKSLKTPISTQCCSNFANVLHEDVSFFVQKHSSVQHWMCISGYWVGKWDPITLCIKLMGLKLSNCDWFTQDAW